VTLVPGTRLGAYEILSPIGAGGMGEVYRARDPKLDRDVALKILPELFALDPERRARFDREARTLAALNHPHIAQIYGLEQSGATSALVMELIDGEDLAQRIARGPIPVDEAIAIAKQIADALEAAHEQGIVHRDLKPANIKLRPDGTAKVLDFGLAKAAAPLSAIEAANSPTFTRLRQGVGEAGSPTQPGVIMGTAAYMAPEQARGKAVDKRADIWAFGCVLYEMLTSRRAFGADNLTDTLAVIVKGDPDWTALPPATPPALRELLAQTLVKDARLRLRDIGDARIVLDRLAGGAAEQPVGPAVARAQTRRFGILHVAGAAAALAGAASVVTWWTLRPVPASPPPLARFVTPLGHGVLPVRRAGAGVAFSPDGGSVVYVGQPMLLSSPVLYRRNLSALDVERLPGTEGAYAPFFSPDGRWIAFFTDKALLKIPVEGGAVSKICDRGTYARAAWAPNGTIILGAGILFAPGALGRVSAAGGTPEPLTTLSGKETLHTHPHVLPDGRHIVFTVVSPDRSEIAIAPIEGGPHRRLGLEGSVPMFAAPRHLLIARDESLLAAPFDVRRLETTGTPVQVLEDAAVFSAARPGVGQLWVPVAGVDAVGSIAYLDGGGSPTVLGWMTSRSAFEEIALPPGEYGPPRLSPNGRRAAVTVGEAAPDVWVVDLERATRLRLTTSGASDPVWSRDGLRIAYRTAQGILSIAADGSGQPESMLSKRERVVVFPTSWSSDGKTIAATVEAEAARGARNRDIWIVRAGGTPVPLLASPADERAGSFSPDSRWLAYASSASGREEVYVRAIDGSGATTPVSRDGGTLPIWSAAGDAIFFQASGPRLMRASFTARPPDVGPATLAASLPATTEGVEVAADGRFLVLSRKQETAARDALHVLLNWGPSLR
jgi:eukaryotic-like serine/threonine-protein kinase